MATTQADIRSWLNEGKERGATDTDLRDKLFATRLAFLHLIHDLFDRT